MFFLLIKGSSVNSINVTGALISGALDGAPAAAKTCTCSPSWEITNSAIDSRDVGQLLCSPGRAGFSQSVTAVPMIFAMFVFSLMLKVCINLGRFPVVKAGRFSTIAFRRKDRLGIGSCKFWSRNIICPFVKLDSKKKSFWKSLMVTIVGASPAYISMLISSSHMSLAALQTDLLAAGKMVPSQLQWQSIWRCSYLQLAKRMHSE